MLRCGKGATPGTLIRREPSDRSRCNPSSPNCPAAERSRCVERRPIPEQPGSGLMACMAGAQSGAARRLAAHPHHALARHRCEMGSNGTARGA